MRETFTVDKINNLIKELQKQFGGNIEIISASQTTDNRLNMYVKIQKSIQNKIEKLWDAGNTCNQWYLWNYDSETFDDNFTGMGLLWEWYPEYFGKNE